MSGERTVPDPAEEIEPRTAAVDSPPATTRHVLGRLPPAHELLSGMSPARPSSEPTRPVGELDPRTAAVDPAPAPARPRLGRLPLHLELPSRIQQPITPPLVSGEPTVPDPVEEIDPLTAAVDPPPAPPRNALGRLPAAPSPAVPRPPPPPPPPRAVAGADTVADVPRATDTVRDLPPGVPDATADDGPALAAPALPMPPAFVPSLETVERPSSATLVEDSASYYCQTCARRVPKAEIQVLTRDGRKAFSVCPVCNAYLGESSARDASVVPRVAARPDGAARPERPRSLGWILVEAIGWPLARPVLPTLLGLTCVVWLLSSAWALGHAHVAIAGLTLAIVVLATRAAAIIDSTQRGDVAPPPLLGEGTAGAVMRHLTVLIVGGLPLLAALASGSLGVRSPTERTMLVVGGAAAFCLYVPAAQIVVAARETFGAALSPFRPIGFAFRVGRAYLLPCAILFGVAITHLVAVGVTRMVGVAIFGSLTVGWGLPLSLVVVAGVLVEARVLGLVVREHPFDLALA